MAKIPVSPEEIFEEFTQDFQKTFEHDLVSIVLYGSGARGEYVPKKSDINFLVVLSDDGIENFVEALDSVNKWRKRGVAAPLFLTKAYIASSLDTFPIEFLNMKTSYKLVHGEDVLKDIQIDKEYLRLQIERELRGKLIYLRQGFLNSGQDRDSLKDLLTASIPTFIAIFSALLYLQKEEVPVSKVEPFEKTAETFDLESSVFKQLVDLKSGQWKPSKMELQKIASSYINQISKLVKVVDKI